MIATVRLACLKSAHAFPHTRSCVCYTTCPRLPEDMLLSARARLALAKPKLLQGGQRPTLADKLWPLVGAPMLRMGITKVCSHKAMRCFLPIGFVCTGIGAGVNAIVFLYCKAGRGRKSAPSAPFAFVCFVSVA